MAIKTMVGGRYGTDAGVALAFGEELGLPVFSTPAAIATIGVGNLAGTYIAEGGATVVWDAGEWAREEFQSWTLRK